MEEIVNMGKYAVYFFAGSGVVTWGFLLVKALS